MPPPVSQAQSVLNQSLGQKIIFQKLNTSQSLTSKNVKVTCTGFYWRQTMTTNGISTEACYNSSFNTRKYFKNQVIFHNLTLVRFSLHPANNCQTQTRDFSGMALFHRVCPCCRYCRTYWLSDRNTFS